MVSGCAFNSLQFKTSQKKQHLEEEEATRVKNVVKRKWLSFSDSQLMNHTGKFSKSSMSSQ